MEAVLQSLMTGLPVLVLEFAVTVAMLAVAVWIYVHLTPYREFALTRDGNMAAAISLGGAILGLALPLAVCMAMSVGVWDIVLWGIVTLFIQIVVFRVTDLILRGLPQRIEAGETAPALVLAAIKLAVAMINAAAISG